MQIKYMFTTRSIVLLPHSCSLSQNLFVFERRKNTAHVNRCISLFLFRVLFLFCLLHVKYYIEENIYKYIQSLREMLKNFLYINKGFSSR